MPDQYETLGTCKGSPEVLQTTFEIFKMAAVSMETGKWTRYWTLQYLGNLGKPPL